MAYVHAKAGADFVAPSAMMDGQIEALDRRLREGGLRDKCKILAYSAKLNNSLGVDANIDAVCELCGLDYKVPFRPGVEFFRPTINI